MAEDHRLDRKTPLRPSDAVAAIIIVEDRYLLQLRDNVGGIFFPAHWGCFGGGIDAGESCKEALVRELREELELQLSSDRLRYFTRFDFDFAFAGLGGIRRNFYEVDITRDELAGLQLREGAAIKLFEAAMLLAGSEPVTPYDGFALWLHINRTRLTR